MKNERSQMNERSYGEDVFQMTQNQLLKMQKIK